MMTLLVTIVISAASRWMKLTKMLDLMLFKALFIFEIWILLSFIKFFLLFLLIGTIICFLDRPFVVMLMWGFGLLFPLIIF